jgi:site-specific DNA-cytosine methylase
MRDEAEQGVRPVKVLVACEFSATVRDAFRARGHDAWSCDLLPTEGDPRHHVIGDALEEIRAGYPGGWDSSPRRQATWEERRREGKFRSWDLVIAHPPCTHLAVSGARHFPEKRADGRQQAALDFVRAILEADVERVALENPVSIISSAIRKPDQIIQPWQFGHGETKATCLWLKGLPLLVPTHTEKPDLFASDAPKEREARVHRMPPGPDRWKERSRTFKGIAEAMADQWGALDARSLAA